MAASTSENMCFHSPFLALPAELRLHIYSFVFSVRRDTHLEEQGRGSAMGIQEKGSCVLGRDAEESAVEEVLLVVSDRITCSRRKGLGKAGPHFAAILQTSRQVHDEAIKVLYQQTLFRIALGAGGGESVDKTGRLQINPKPMRPTESEVSGGYLLQDLSLFSRMLYAQLDLDFGKQVNPIWDALPVIRAVLGALKPGRKHITARLRFGLMTAVTCARLSDDMWRRFLGDVRTIDFRGCVPDVEVDHAVERRTRYGRGRFEELTGTLGGELRFVKFEESLGPHDDSLRNCVILWNGCRDSGFIARCWDIVDGGDSWKYEACGAIDICF